MDSQIEQFVRIQVCWLLLLDGSASCAVPVEAVTDEEVIDVLVGLGYRRETVTTPEPPVSTGNLLTFPMKNPDQWRDEWDVLRALVTTIERWPVAVDRPVDHQRRRTLSEKSRTGAEAIGAVVDGHSDDLFEFYQPDWLHLDGTAIEGIIKELWSLPDDLADRWIKEASDELGEEPNPRDVEAWVVNKQFREGQPDVPNWRDEDPWRYSTSHLEWIVLAPTVGPVDAIAFLQETGTDAAEDLAVCRRWVTDHQVELVAAPSCTYLFEMPQPLTDPYASWRLAIERLGLWYDTSGGGPSGFNETNLPPMHWQSNRFDGTQGP